MVPWEYKLDCLQHRGFTVHQWPVLISFKSGLCSSVHHYVVQSHNETRSAFFAFRAKQRTALKAFLCAKYILAQLLTEFSSAPQHIVACHMMTCIQCRPLHLASNRYPLSLLGGKIDWVALNVIDRRFKFFFHFFQVYIGNKNVLKLPAG